MATKQRKPAKRYRVYAGGGYTSMWPMTRADARRVAAEERAKPWNKGVRVEEETDPALIRIANG